MILQSALFGIISGIIASDLINVKYVIIFAICILIVFGVISLLSRRIFTPLLIFVIFMSSGFIFGYISLNIDNSAFRPFDETDVSIRGKIVDLPSKNKDNFSYMLDVHEIICEDNIHTVQEKLMLTTKSEFNYGDVICATGKIKSIPENHNENSFNSYVYYKSKDISRKMYSENCEKLDIKLNTYDLYSLTTTVRSEIYKTINEFYSGDDAALLSAIAVGNKDTFSDEFDALIKRTGVKRCLYPAFLQIMIFMTLMTLLQNIIPQKCRFVALTIFLLFFGVANSANPIFVKSALYVGLFNIVRQIFGYSLKQDWLFITVIAMLLANPLLLYDGGFVMSVVANILIIYFLDFVCEKLKFLHFKYLKRTVAISFICTIGLMPFSSYYFNGTASYQLMATLTLIPLTATIFILSPILVILLKVFGTAPLISNIINILLYIYKGIPYYIDKLPFTYITLPTPSIGTIVAFYLLVYALYLYIDKRKYIFPLIAAAIIYIFIIAAQIVSSYTAQITFINVGQGDAALISVPFRCNIIIDGGGGYEFKENDSDNETYNEYNIGEEIFVPYLQTHGKTVIDAAFISHYHKDHVEGILAAIENLCVKTVYMPDLLPENEWRLKIEKAAKLHNTTIKYVTKDSTITFEEGIIVEAIFPTKTALLSGEENNTTVVYKMIYGKTSALFTGDMTALYEASLVYKNKDLSADILKVAHHGSATSTTKEFVKAVSPEYAIICTDKNNPYGFPRKEVLDNLTDIIVYRTDQNGDIRFTLNRNGIKSIYTLR